MYRVILAGTIWDLDDYVYPELDEMKGMTAWNYYQIMKYQLISNRKEMEAITKEKSRRIRVGYATNEQNILVKRICASCQHKCIGARAARRCKLTGNEVGATDKCRHWLLSEAMKNAGLRNGGVVRNVVTKEVVIP